MDKVVKNDIYTIFENRKTQYGYEYNPVSGNPDYNPRILTLLFDGNSTSVMAAIGDLKEEAGPSFNQHSATWVGCSHAVLSETHPQNYIWRLMICTTLMLANLVQDQRHWNYPLFNQQRQPGEQQQQQTWHQLSLAM